MPSDDAAALKLLTIARRHKFEGSKPKMMPQKGLGRTVHAFKSINSVALLWLRRPEHAAALRIAGFDCDQRECLIRKRLYSARPLFAAPVLTSLRERYDCWMGSLL